MLFLFRERYSLRVLLNSAEASYGPKTLNSRPSISGGVCSIADRMPKSSKYSARDCACPRTNQQRQQLDLWNDLAPEFGAVLLAAYSGI